MPTPTDPNAPKKMVEPKSWEEFQSTGLLLLVNQFLHIFGWAIAFRYDEDKKLIDVKPCRCKFRGFDSKPQDEAYKNVSQYMKDNADELLQEASEETP